MVEKSVSRSTAWAERQMALAREWDDLVEEVRTIEGFEDFLKAPSIDSMLAAAAEGSVVVLNVSQSRCDALVVTTAGVEAVPLRDLTLSDSRDRAAVMLSALRRFDSAADELARAEREVATDGSYEMRKGLLAAGRRFAEIRGDANRVLSDLQLWMWRSIAEPVLDHLDLHGAPPDGEKLARIWWCPTGPLALLPIHAAADTTDEAPRDASVLDRAISSYTPTLRALRDAREADHPTEGGNRFLVLALEDSDGEPTLAGSLEERDAIGGLLPAARLTVLGHGGATRAQVLSALSSHRWVHFGCHADQDLSDPSSGGLILTDGTLSIAEISDHQFRGEFAGLAACKTAVGGLDLLDESITAAAALQFTGFRHVVASLWSIDDATSSTVFTGLYRQLIRDGIMDTANAALALHQLIVTQRDLQPTEPLSWAPFVHLGP